MSESLTQSCKSDLTQHQPPYMGGYSWQKHLLNTYLKQLKGKAGPEKYWTCILFTKHSLNVILIQKAKSIIRKTSYSKSLIQKAFARVILNFDPERIFFSQKMLVCYRIRLQLTAFAHFCSFWGLFSIWLHFVFPVKNDQQTKNSL